MRISRLGLILFILGVSLPVGGLAQEKVHNLNAAPDVAFTGSKSCADAGCHEKLYNDYYRTPHGMSMGPANAPSELAKVPKRTTVFNKSLDCYLEVVREGSDLYQTEYQLDSSGNRTFSVAHKLDYRIGGHLTGNIYVVRWGPYLFQAPLSYYLKTKGWDMAPGYENAPRAFNRAIALCPYCHNGQPQPVADRPGMYHDPPFRFGEYGIGCEVCHGPGALHLERLRQHPEAVSGNVDPTIVDPAKLPPRLADDICLKCHEGWAARVLQPGKTELDFRPGTPLYDTVALFKVPITPDRRAELDRLETLPPVKGTISTPMWFKHSLMEMSRCYHDSNGKLRCITCHIIHNPPTEENKVAYYRERCFTCHTNKSCKLSLAERSRRQPANDCVGCHMPRKGVAGIPHSDDTNHRIVRRAGQSYPDYAFEQSDPDLPGLRCINRRGGEASQPIPLLTKLRAYSELMMSKKHPEAAQTFLAILEQARKSDPDDPTVLVCLGRKALAEQQNTQAVQHLTRALEKGAQYDSTYLDLSEALARLGRFEECAKVLEQGVATWPFSAEIRQALILCYMKLDRPAQVQRALQEYVHLFPEDPIARQALTGGRPGER